MQKHRGRNAHDVFLKGALSPGDGVGKKVRQGRYVARLCQRNLDFKYSSHHWVLKILGMEKRGERRQVE